MNVDLFKSRKWWAMVVGLVMMAIVHFVPDLAENADQLTESILIVVGLLIGGYALEDSAVAFRSGEHNPKYKK
jgi:hypothetical protein